MEEAQEAAEAEEADLIVELADLLEVIEATAIAYGLERDQVVACQAQRHRERGGFSQQLRLLWTEVQA
jgi:predicted house-cleaning noncanonical NTP pyrophosphatase (MazG superfamily)